MVQVYLLMSLLIELLQGCKFFVFDRVFGFEVGQVGIWEYLDEGVNVFIQGYNVFFFVYGQFGVGKFYMMGIVGDQDSLE